MESHKRVSIDSATRLDHCSKPGVMWIWFHRAYNVEHRTSDAIELAGMGSGS